MWATGVGDGGVGEAIAGDSSWRVSAFRMGCSGRFGNRGRPAPASARPCSRCSTTSWSSESFLLAWPLSCEPTLVYAPLCCSGCHPLLDCPLDKLGAAQSALPPNSLGVGFVRRRSSGWPRRDECLRAKHSFGGHTRTSPRVVNAIVCFEVVGRVDLVDACVRAEYRNRVGVLGLRPFAGRRRWQSVPQPRD